MVLNVNKLISLFFISLLLCCSQVERDNTYDPDGVNYLGGIDAVSSSGGGSSSSSSSSIYIHRSEYDSFEYGDQTYKTIVIGNQTWMAENLNYNLEGSKCYNNDDANCETYGRLYLWETAIWACPDGWHLPSNEEWLELINLAGGANAGAKLKSKSGWRDSENETDEYNFSALPGGYGNSYETFGGIEYFGYWWSATEYATNEAYEYFISYNNDSVEISNANITSLSYVRCVKD